MRRYEGTQLPQLREIRYNKISVTTVRVIFHVYIDVNESINLSKVVEMWYFDMPCYPNIHPGQCETAEIATDTFELGRERRNQW